MYKASFIAVVLIILALISLTVFMMFRPSLDRIHSKIEGQFTSVQHIKNDALATLNKQDVVIFDIREKPEFHVSHLRGAIHVLPSVSAHDFFTQYSHIIKNKQAIFYCSVGYRSSAFIEKLNKFNRNKDHSTSNMVNLQGGLFKWSNQNKPIIGEGVHPYNDFWSKLINDKHKIRYLPFDRSN